MAKELISAGVAQQYGQIILGYLAEASIMFKALKEKTSQKQEQKLIGEGNLGSIITKIENAFGDINLDEEL